MGCGLWVVGCGPAATRPWTNPQSTKDETYRAECTNQTRSSNSANFAGRAEQNETILWSNRANWSGNGNNGSQLNYPNRPEITTAPITPGSIGQAPGVTNIIAPPSFVRVDGGVLADQLKVDLAADCST